MGSPRRRGRPCLDRRRGSEDGVCRARHPAGEPPRGELRRRAPGRTALRRGLPHPARAGLSTTRGPAIGTTPIERPFAEEPRRLAVVPDASGRPPGSRPDARRHDPRRRGDLDAAREAGRGAASTIQPAPRQASAACGASDTSRSGPRRRRGDERVRRAWPRGRGRAPGGAPAVPARRRPRGARAEDGRARPRGGPFDHPRRVRRRAPESGRHRARSASWRVAETVPGALDAFGEAGGPAVRQPIAGPFAGAGLAEPMRNQAGPRLGGRRAGRGRLRGSGGCRRAGTRRACARPSETSSSRWRGRGSGSAAGGALPTGSPGRGTRRDEAPGRASRVVRNDRRLRSRRGRSPAPRGRDDDRAEGAGGRVGGPRWRVRARRPRGASALAAAPLRAVLRRVVGRPRRDPAHGKAVIVATSADRTAPDDARSIARGASAPVGSRPRARSPARAGRRARRSRRAGSASPRCATTTTRFGARSARAAPRAPVRGWGRLRPEPGHPCGSAALSGLGFVSEEAVARPGVGGIRAGPPRVEAPRRVRTSPRTAAGVATLAARSPSGSARVCERPVPWDDARWRRRVRGGTIRTRGVHPDAATPPRASRSGIRAGAARLPAAGVRPERDVVSSGEARARSQGWPGRPGPRGGVPPSRSSAGDPGTAEGPGEDPRAVVGAVAMGGRGAEPRARSPERPRSAAGADDARRTERGKVRDRRPPARSSKRRPRRSRVAREERRALGARDGRSAERGVGAARRAATRGPQSPARPSRRRARRSPVAPRYHRAMASRSAGVMPERLAGGMAWVIAAWR